MIPYLRVEETIFLQKHSLEPLAANGSKIFCMGSRLGKDHDDESAQKEGMGCAK